MRNSFFPLYTTHFVEHCNCPIVWRCDLHTMSSGYGGAVVLRMLKGNTRAQCTLVRSMSHSLPSISLSQKKKEKKSHLGQILGKDSAQVNNKQDHFGVKIMRTQHMIATTFMTTLKSRTSLHASLKISKASIAP